MAKIFDPDLITLNDLFGSNYEIPVYQRPYSWGKEQVEDLYNDIIQNYDANKAGISSEGVYTGTIYLKHIQKKGKYDFYYVIDGQQRITSFTLMMLAIYWILKDRKAGQKNKTYDDLKGNLWRYSTSAKDYVKDDRILALGNLDKDMLVNIFNAAYDKRQTFSDFYIKTTKKDRIECEKLLLENLRFFYDSLSKKFSNPVTGNDDLLDFYDYLNCETQFIVIYVNFPENRIFEIFESINSKGKQLEQIDLIKSYIFQILPSNDYSEYSNDWGELIKRTKDDLEDYLYVFIKAFIKFYNYAINVKMFKALCNSELCQYYGTKTEAEAVKALIKDMLDKVDLFMMLKDSSLLQHKLKNDNQFKFYYNCINWLNYKHPKPLLFKALCLYEKNNLIKNDVVKIFRNSLSFMLSYQTIFARDSKDAIPVFRNILQSDYGRNVLDCSTISSEFIKKLNNEDVTVAAMKEKLKLHRGYDNSDKSETIVLLAFYESFIQGKINYNNANIIMQNRSMFHIDHILPQTPDPADTNFSYYCEKDAKTKEEVLRLKNGHDFSSEAKDGMEYDDFKGKFLHKLGNLRIMQSTNNITKSNTVATIGNYSTFNTYQQVSDRTEKIAEALYNSDLLTIS